ncbi:hypothetical protein, partial [Flavonifractor plautii]|uniref:hypothetical protein n=1 Tax=Flavonifractor plautii TaxID=292800 RepID=UPI001A9BDD64
MRKIGAPGLLLISPLWRNPGRLVENTPHLQDNRHFLFYPVSFPANKLHNKILFAKSALFGVPFVHYIQKWGKVIVRSIIAVDTVIYRKETDIFLRKQNFTIIDKSTKRIGTVGINPSDFPSDFPFNFYLFICCPDDRYQCVHHLP